MTRCPGPVTGAVRLRNPIRELRVMHLVTPKQWQQDYEPVIAAWAKTAGSDWRRHRAILGPWVLEYVGDNDSTYRFFSQHRKTAHLGEPPDAYCYHLSHLPNELQNAEALPTAVPEDQPSRGNQRGPTAEHRSQAAPLPHCAVCPDTGRAFIGGPARYADVNQICEFLITALAARGTKGTKADAKRRPAGSWWVLCGCCVEYQTETGDCRSLALLGKPGLETSAHGYALTLCKPENGLVNDGLTCIQMDTRSAISATSRLLWPTSLVTAFSHLLPYFATSPLEGVDLDADLTGSLRNLRYAEDLSRAIDDGSFAEEKCTRLARILVGASDAQALLDPTELLGADRCLEQSKLTDLISCTSEPEADFIVRDMPRSDFIARTAQHSCWSGGRFGDAIQQAHHHYVNRLLEQFAVRPVVLNTRLPIPQTQFCLRHFLENRSDSVQLLLPGSPCDPALLRAMHLDERTRDQTNDPGATERCFVHGPRRVDLVSFELQGRRAELVAFDPSVEGYAQVRSVWPGQVADFFSRHADMRVRELFTEISTMQHSPAIDESQELHTAQPSSV